QAALRAFADDQRFVGQTYIAVSPDNMDPCELRLAKGDAAVRDLVARRERLISFALRSVLSRYDLDPAEGRVGALGASAPLVEREALKLALQAPALAGPMFDAIATQAYGHPVHAALRDAIAEAGGASSAAAGAVWTERVRDACADLAAKALVTELAVEPLRV